MFFPPTHTPYPAPRPFHSPRRWAGRIVHHVVEKSNVADPWARETNHRNELAKGAATAISKHAAHQGRSEEDVYFSVMDVDEVPRRELYAVVKQCTGFRVPILAPLDRFFYYNLHWLKSMAWTVGGPGIIPWNQRSAFVPQNSRNNEYKSPEAVFKRGGWHMSYFLTPAKIVDKLQSFSHTEYRNPP